MYCKYTENIIKQNIKHSLFSGGGGACCDGEVGPGAEFLRMLNPRVIGAMPPAGPPGDLELIVMLRPRPAGEDMSEPEPGLMRSRASPWDVQDSLCASECCGARRIKVVDLVPRCRNRLATGQSGYRVRRGTIKRRTRRCLSVSIPGDTGELRVCVGSIRSSNQFLREMF